MSQLRAQAELFFTNGNTFTALCSAAKSVQGVKEMKESIEKNATGVICASDKFTWAVIADIKDEGKFCADSTGYAGPATSGPTVSTTTGDASTPAVCIVP